MSKIFWKRTDNMRLGCEAEIWEAETIEQVHEDIRTVLIDDDATAEFEIFICEKASKITADISLRSEPIDV